ncbi:GNAT family N-acetyltransferase [Crocinitomix algicola]|uniref:GNAT family N-acetyltransferase n=1 Tax=Crocinitomix algicola TaxID=1740263 RepID=UPI0008354BA0|nr:GNAT family N-acetyltransferase [Crocinitomix algicola]
MLTGDKIYLRTIEPEDADALYAWENDPENWRVSNTIVPFSKNLIKQYVNQAQDLFQLQQIRFIICELNQNLPVGTVDLFEFDPFNQRAGVGVLIQKEFRGNGYAFESLELLADYAVNNVGIRNLHASVMGGNTNSLKLFEKAGYKMIGKRKNWFVKGGDWEDECLFQKELI